jgi:transposase
VVSVDSSINRAHQHAAGTRKTAVPETAGRTGGQSNDNSPTEHPGPRWVGRGSPEPTDHGLGHFHRPDRRKRQRHHHARRGLGRDPGPTTRPGATANHPRAPAGRQGLLLGSQPRSAGWTRSRRHDPRARRPARQPDPTRPRRRAPIRLRQDAYKGRNIVEQAFNRLKQWRGVATRYAKTAVIYRAGIVLASMTIWLTT